jgi:hypothetical protein
MPQYVDPLCGPALGHRITIPFPTFGIDTVPFGYTLGHKDYTVKSNPGDARVSVKVGRFVDTISAVNRTFDIKLFNLTADTYLKIKQFARADYLNFLNTGSGNITLDLDNETYTGCYIMTPLQSSESIFDTTSGIEYFEEISLSLNRPSYTWY